jgi:hypothetical protein
VELRAAGPTFAAIATQLGVSDEAARKAVNRALDAIRAEISQGADRLRAMEAARLDRAAAVLAPKVEAGTFARARSGCVAAPATPPC